LDGEMSCGAEGLHAVIEAAYSIGIEIVRKSDSTLLINLERSI
jgi:hypothetical protein